MYERRQRSAHHVCRQLPSVFLCERGGGLDVRERSESPQYQTYQLYVRVELGKECARGRAFLAPSRWGATREHAPSPTHQRAERMPGTPATAATAGLTTRSLLRVGPRCEGDGRLLAIRCVGVDASPLDTLSPLPGARTASPLLRAIGAGGEPLYGARAVGSCLRGHPAVT